MRQVLDNVNYTPLKQKIRRFNWGLLHIDPLLFLFLGILAATGLFTLYSASIENFSMIMNQAARIGGSFLIMILFAQIPPRRYYQWAPWLFLVTLILLVMVLMVGKIGQGARRWLGFSFLRFQPSEIMKLAMPMMLAWFYSHFSLPPRFKILFASLILVLVPFLLIAKQPDLGTAILIAISGFAVIFFAGISYRLIISILTLIGLSIPILWHYLHSYQKERVLTFLDPEKDPLGSGYHIIQSKIAIGSGGFYGKGWMGGTQSHLSFLPAHTTDFIFAVNGEEMGFVGCIIILTILFCIFLRCLYISVNAQDTFTRLLCGSLTMMFVLCSLFNISMVIGILPVVGIPLPLVSYGGSTVLTMLASFGMIMSVHTHRKFWSN